MKMSDEFKLPIIYFGSCYTESNSDFFGGGNYTKETAKAMAVNHHDNLVKTLSAAMEYIKECPCDPDIYPEQLEAWNRLQELNPQSLLERLTP